MTKKFLFTALIALILTSCEKTHDVEYYLKHPEERKAKLEKCRNNPAEASRDDNCKNVKAAELRRMFDSSNTGMPKIK